MSSSASETDPLLPRATTAQRKPSFIWLVPVVALASICRGISMFARFEHYQKTFCPGTQYPCGWFAIWLELPSITVLIQTWGVWASFIVSFVSVGWWSALGDRRGRKIPLFFSVLGAVFTDLMYLIVANTSPSQEDAHDVLSLGLIVGGLLGGFATYNGAVYAYAFDVSPTPLSRPVFFGLIDALSLIGFIIGAIIGKVTRYNVSYVFSVIIAIGNLAFIYTLLPESLEQQDGARPVVPQRSVFKSIFSPISVFFRGPGSSKYLPLFGLAFYTYSLTSAMETSLLRWTDLSPFFPGLPRAFLLIVSRVLELATLLCIIPGLAWFWARKSGTTSPLSSPERAGLQLSASLSQNSILIAAVSSTGVLVFCLPDHAKLLFALFVPLYPLTVGAAPPLYALGAAYLVALGRKSEVGVLFGAMGVWGELALMYSYSMYGPGQGIFFESAFFLVVSLMLLLPDPPPVQEEEAPQANVEADAAADV